MKAPTTFDESKKIKPTAQPHGYRRIFDLGPDKVALLNSYLLTETYSLARIVEILQVDWGVFRDVSRGTLTRQLFRYKHDFIVPEQARIATRLTNDVNVAKLAAAAKQIEQNLDSVKELEWAIQLQLKRVKKMEGAETKHDTILKEQTRNIALLTEQLVKLADIQLSIGVLKKVPTRVALSADLSAEEMRFAEEAKLHNAETTVMAEAIKYLRAVGVLDAPGLPAAKQIVDSELVEEANGTD